ncbi:hypothetical protein GS426_20210 [Rhodococcus hoagii]|nr:hypothetical protein [Prescottella equi]
MAIFESITLAFNPGEVRVGPKSALAHTMLLPAQALGKFRDSTSGELVSQFAAATVLGDSLSVE